MKYIFEYGLWETDFFLNEILPKGDVDYILTENIENTQNECDVFVFSCVPHTFLNIHTLIKRIKPKIIIMVSDEFYNGNNSVYNQLGNDCELFLRQYNHSNYTYTSNTIHIPLGYTNGCKVFKENKHLKWSWFGEIKSDRKEMLTQFNNLKLGLSGKSISKELMCKIYSQSVFVPCGRGNSSLDCFRLYEASMNGAIPVLVGSNDEIKSTFKYEENPPWIFAKTWSEAVEKCMNTKINSQNVLEWWNTRIEKIRTQILEVL